MKGLKYDEGKPDYTLVNKELMDGIAQVMMFGASKYGRDNYRLFTKDDIGRFEAAALRHMFQHTSGELLDSQSGLPHIDHVGACLNILAYLRGLK